VPPSVPGDKGYWRSLARNAGARLATLDVDGFADCEMTIINPWSDDGACATNVRYADIGIRDIMPTRRLCRMAAAVLAETPMEVHAEAA
jgi:hypothetical protein